MVSNILEILVVGHYIKGSFEVHSRQDNFFHYILSYREDMGLKCDSSKVYDACVVLNRVNSNQIIRTRRKNMFALMQEPGTSREKDPFMFKGLHQYNLVYSPIKQSINTIQSHGYLGWHVQMEYDELLSLLYPQKKKQVSCIISGVQYLEGHKLRYGFRNTLIHSSLKIDYYGKNTNYIKDKADGLLSYYYSIAIENSSKDYYFTEKINDCFLCYTIPFYYGCTNIDKFFPSKSYVWIDITDPQKAIKTIRDTLEYEDPKDRLPYLQEAREIVLHKYNIHGFVNEIIPVIKRNIKNKAKIYKIIAVRDGDEFNKYKRFVSKYKRLIRATIIVVLKKFKLYLYVKKVYRVMKK